MTNQILLSILVPVYNSGSTIERCINSLCEENVSDYEIVIVDDGSEDKSYEKLDHLSERFRFLKIVSQNNAGVSATRQKLITLAQGKYLMFCDSDDYFEPETIKYMMNLLHSQTLESNSPDIYIFGYNLVRSWGSKSINKRHFKNGIYQKRTVSKYHVNGISDLYWSALWNKCYKRELCVQPPIIFEKCMEDVMFNVDYMSRVKNIYVSERRIYNYVQIGESLTRTKRTDTTESIIEADTAYSTLMGKLLTTYPEDRTAILSRIYRYYKSLDRRATAIGERKRVDCSINAIKKQLKCRVFYVDLIFYIDFLLRRAKKIMIEAIRK